MHMWMSVETPYREKYISSARAKKNAKSFKSQVNVLSYITNYDPCKEKQTFQLKHNTVNCLKDLAFYDFILFFSLEVWK